MKDSNGHLFGRLTILLLFILLLALASPAHAAVTRLTCTAANDTTGAGTITTAAINTNSATLIVVVTLSGAGTPAAPTDSQGLTWTARTQYDNGSTAGKIRLYYTIPTSTSGTHTFTNNPPGAGPAIAVCAYSGTHTSAPYDVENGDTTNPLGSTVQPGSVTPSQNNEVLVTGAGQNFAGDSFTINSGFTIQAQITASAFSGGIGIADEIQTTATARNPTWTLTNFQNVSANIATFKVAAAATPRSFIIGGGVF